MPRSTLISTTRPTEDRLRIVGHQLPSGQRIDQIANRTIPRDGGLPIRCDPASRSGEERQPVVTKVGDRSTGHLGGRTALRFVSLVGLAPVVRDHSVAQGFLQALQGRLQLEAPHEAPQSRPVDFMVEQPVEIDSRVEVGDHRRKALRDPRVIGMLDQVLLPLCARHLVDVLEDGLERAELTQQGSCGLVPYSRDARDVVGAVALQADQIGYLIGSYPVAL